jgi:hypothetical protein
MPVKRTAEPKVLAEERAESADTPETRARAAFDAYRQRVRSPGEAEPRSEAHAAPWPQAPWAPPWGFPVGRPTDQPPESFGGRAPRMGTEVATAPGSTIDSLGTLLGLSIELVNTLLRGGTQLLYGIAGPGHAHAGDMHPVWGPSEHGSPHACGEPCGHCLYGACGCGCHPGVHSCG